MIANQSDSIFHTLKRVYQLLREDERRRLAVLLLSTLANSLVEILGLAAIVPVVGLVVQPKQIQTNVYLKRAFELSNTVGVDTPNGFLILLCVVMIGAFLFKAMFGLTVNLFQTRFAFAVAHRLSGQMWSHHFSQSLEQMRGSNSGRILSEINSWPLSFANIFMVGGLLILTELSVISLIAAGLLLYNPVVFSCIAGLLAIGAVIIRVATKRRLEMYSATRKAIEPLTNTLITNAVRGFLEVISFRATNAVRNAYLRDRQSIFRIQGNTSVLNTAPAKLYEVLAVMAVAGSIIIALLQGTPELGFLQLLSFMAISAYRTMPSMSRINGAIMGIRSHRHVLETMEIGMRSSRPYVPSAVVHNYGQNQSVSIQLENVTLAYEALENPVIERLSHTFATGKLHGIVGASGSGKSTLISSLLGLHPAQHGAISVHLDAEEQSKILGTDINLHDWILNVGYLSQQPFLFSGTVRENLTLGVPEAPVNEELVKQLVKQLSLDDCLGSDPLSFQLQEGGSNLSGGQQQRLALLRALQIQRPVLILDEATSALDQSLRNVVFELLSERVKTGCNVILVTHDLELANRCDHVLDLSRLAKVQAS